ncbi:MAG: GatB/YqeY domain-containing protein [bacterium]|nr:GatB/YqeY domain-containing protein [bacterium]
MGLAEKLQTDLVVSLKSKDEVAVSALRSLKSALKNDEIENGPLSEGRAFSIVKKQIKQREDSAATYKSAGREELAYKEEAEIEVLRKYQPEQLSEEKLRELVKQEVATAENKEFGPLMGKVMQATQGKADGKMVQKILKEELQ